MTVRAYSECIFETSMKAGHSTLDYIPFTDRFYIIARLSTPVTSDEYYLENWIIELATPVFTLE